MGATTLFVEIWLQECLDEHLQAWFEGMAFSTPVNGATRLTGIIPDHSRLHGLLERIRDLNLKLISVQVQELSAAQAE